MPREHQLETRVEIFPVVENVENVRAVFEHDELAFLRIARYSAANHRIERDPRIQFEMILQAEQSEFRSVLLYEHDLVLQNPVADSRQFRRDLIVTVPAIVIPKDSVHSVLCL